MHKTSHLLTTVALAGALTFSACSPSGSKPAASGPGAASSDVSSSPAPAAPRVAAALAGAAMVTFSAPQESVEAVTPRFRNARLLSTAAEVVRGRMLRGAWQSGASKVVVTSQLVASSDAVLGLAQTATVTTAKGDVTIPATTWYSAATGRVYSSPALVRSTQWKAYTDALTKAAGDQKLDTSGLAKLLAQPAAPYGQGPALSFTAQGDLVAAFRTGALGQDAATLTVPAASATPLLSVLGGQAQKAAMNPTAFTGTTTQPADPELGKGNVRGRPTTAVGPDCRVLHCVAITYDDGPSDMTPRLLQTLKKNKASVTFFEMGDSIKEYPQIARQVAAAGMEIGNHTLTHPNLPADGQERVQHEIAGNSELIKGFTGATPLLFRPPYGAHNSTVDAVAKQQGMAVIQWEVDTEDWRTHSASKTLASATSAWNYHATIVLEHDIQQASIDAAPQIYPALAARGVTVVSVSELSLNSGGYTAGHAYCRGTSIPQEGFNCKG